MKNILKIWIYYFTWSFKHWNFILF